MSGQNWWHRIGLVVCIVASVGVVSGCEFNMDNLKTNSQVKATQSDSEKEIWRVFRFYLAATNEFNFTSVKYSHQHMETVQQAQQNVPLAEFKVRDYERLEQELIAAREAGHTHSDLEAATDALLPVLHDVVVVVKELDTYYKEKRYESDNYAFAHTQLEKLSSLIEAFGPKYNALDTIVKTYHKQEGERLVKLMRNNGQKRHLDNAIEDFMANPSSETEEAVVEQYNEMVRSPMNFKLLDSVQKPYVPQEL
ncbi:MAG: hypothetical protein E6419_04880 [Veillonella sp.]|nr:hypothetical protein [Veillonella sp.]